VGIGSWHGISTHTGRIQLDPPGIYLPNTAGQGYLLNDSNAVWYLYRNRHHKYEWVDSQNAEAVPFAVDFSSDDQGFPLYIGRIRSENRTVRMGIVVSFMGTFFYLDFDGRSRSNTSGYQVLTCKSCRKEKKVPLPKLPVVPPTPAQLNGCGESKN
jgi:hypothetical protein